MATPWLGFHHAARIPPAGKLMVESSTDDKTWKIVASFGTANAWARRGVFLPGLGNKRFRLRFRYVQTSCNPAWRYYQGVYIDDLLVRDLACKSAADCDDGNECTSDGCSSGHCLFDPRGYQSCDDGAPCTAGGRCAPDICRYGPAKSCDDGNACTTDGCLPLAGKCASVQSPDGQYCNDGLACTSSDRCKAGKCAGVNTCDDGEPCTEDACVPKGSGGTCLAVPFGDGHKCDDLDACTPTATCKAGKCSLKPKACDDGNPKTFDACDPRTGACLHNIEPAHCTKDADCKSTNACYGGGTCASDRCTFQPTKATGCCYPLLVRRFDGATPSLEVTGNDPHTKWQVRKPAPHAYSPLGALWFGNRYFDDYAVHEAGGKVSSSKYPRGTVELGVFHHPADKKVRIHFRFWADAETVSYRDTFTVRLATTDFQRVTRPVQKRYMPKWKTAWQVLDTVVNYSALRGRDVRVLLDFDARSAYKNSTAGLYIDDFQVLPANCSGDGKVVP